MILAVLAAAVVIATSFQALFRAYWGIGLIGVLVVVGVTLITGGFFVTIRNARRSDSRRRRRS